MSNKPTYNELESQIAELKKQNELLKLSANLEQKISSPQVTKENEPTLSLENPLFIITTDLEGIITDINNTGGGFTKEDIIGKSALNFVKVEHQSFVHKTLQKVKQDGIQVNYESSSLGLDKISRNFITHVVPIIQNELITGLTLITKDITEDKLVLDYLQASQKEIQKNENEFHSTIENLLVGVIVHGSDTQILFSNREASNIIGLSPAQMLGKDVIDPEWMFVYEDSTPMKLEDYPVNKVIKTQKPLTNFVCGIIRKERDFITWVNVNAMPFFNSDDGTLEKVVNNFIDITDHKRSVQALIENQRLGAIGEMASSIAHDFNNSLQAIYGNIELSLLEENIGEQTLNYLKIIKKVVTDVAHRVQLLQRFGGKNQAKSNYTKVSVNSLIDEVLLQTRPIWKDELERKGSSIQLKKKQYANLPNIFCNESDMRTVFYNIIKNSIESMPHGGEILIESKEKYKKIYISITDTGIGMDEETRARIFQPFFTTKGFELGRGLGMSGAYGIVKEHGFDIFVKNTEFGKGTTLEISIPLTQEDDLKENETISIKEKETKEFLKVLWVEDDAIIRLNAGLMLKKGGHTIDTASSGKKALEFLKKHTYDVVITDIGMPEMSGWQLADIIKEKYRKTPIVVVSGWGLEIDEVQMQKHGVIAVISKPFHFDQVKKVLETIEKIHP
jgi:PAS domain S-box-containing protein